MDCDKWCGLDGTDGVIFAAESSISFHLLTSLVTVSFVHLLSVVVAEQNVKTGKWY